VLLVPTLSAIDLDGSLKKLGAGLVSEHRLQRHVEALWTAVGERVEAEASCVRTVSADPELSANTVS